MTTSEARAAVPAVTGSLLIGTNAPDSLFGTAVYDAAYAVPEMPLSRRVKGGFRPANAAFVRRIHWRQPDPSRLVRRVWLGDDAVSPEHADKNYNVWSSEVNLVEPPNYPDFVGRFASVVRFTILGLEFHGTLSGAAQLALFRHLLWRAYVGLDPQSMAVGDHDWRPDFWPDRPAGE